MVLKNLSVLVLWMKVASAMEGLKCICAKFDDSTFFHNFFIVVLYRHTYIYNKGLSGFHFLVCSLRLVHLMTPVLSCMLCNVLSY